MTAKKKWITLAALAMVFALAVAVVAQAGPHGRGKWRGGGPRQDCGELGPPMHEGFGPHRMGMRWHRGMGRWLDLTDEQRSKIRSIRESYRTEMKNLRTQLRELKDRVEPMIDKGDYEGAFDAGTELRKRMFVLRGEMLSKIRGILTEEQIEKREKQRERFKERMEHRFKNRRQDAEQ